MLFETFDQIPDLQKIASRRQIGEADPDEPVSGQH
jgi:hypothetical protein